MLKTMLVEMIDIFSNSKTAVNQAFFRGSEIEASTCLIVLSSNIWSVNLVFWNATLLNSPNSSEISCLTCQLSEMLTLISNIEVKTASFRSHKFRQFSYSQPKMVPNFYEMWKCQFWFFTCKIIDLKAVSPLCLQTTADLRTSDLN